MKKKVLSLLLTLCLAMTFVPMAAFAAEAPLFGGGTGTQQDPWLITSQADLIALAEFLNSGNAETFDAENAGVGNCHGYYFKQTADIDLTGVTWEPIGYSGGGYYFAGNYDGDGHTISNATSTGKNDADGCATAGIFGWVAFGSVENLHVKNANFVATGHNEYSYVGGIAGVCYGSSIKNCSVVDSSLESRRDNNNNCAGSIVGYSTGGTFEKCAAENNQVKTMCYGGGFVGEVDDTYGVGNSTLFTNCYVTKCTVISETDDSQGTSFSGGFAGEMTDSTLTLQNCYVYQTALSTAGNAVPQGTGVFAGNLWGGCNIVDTNCYFGACGTTERAGAAAEKSGEEFENGTVAGSLGDAFAQARNYPRFKDSPADYSAVDAAIAKANALNKDNYKDFSAVETAINSVVRGKKLAEQAEVDAMAKAIETALSALQYKDADYTKVDAAIAKANALNKDNYKDFSAVEAAVNAVARGKNITEQGEVDAMAKAIETALAALQHKDADYTKVDAAIAKANALKKDDYKDFSAVESAVNAVVRGKNITEQGEVDAMAKAIEDALAALQYKDADKTTPAPTATATPAPTATATPEPAATATPAPAATAIPQYTIPQTGDTSNPALLVVLMLVSGSASIGIAVVGSKKKHNG
ncbi:MAG: LPXTG cell wall anchor domain-containing protein [Christensenellales bacterium]